MKFDELNLPEELLRAVDDLGFVQATPIQEKALPLALDGVDVAGQAQTGTGKTACFLLSTFERLLRSDRAEGKAPRALVIAPTRELAMQIAANGERLSIYTDLIVAAVYGGSNWEQQAKKLREGADVVVGTPGRLIDYHKRGVLDLRRIEAVVVDEADRMFDMGFIADLNYLLHRCPSRSRRQSMLFSATLSDQVLRLARAHMRDPVKVVIEPEHLIVEQIEEVLYHVGGHEKVSLLLGRLEKERPTRAMIFVNRKVVGEELTWRLNQNGHRAVYLSGDLQQKKRTAIIAAFKAGRIDLLVATDVASRGIHVDDVSHVFNYDVPQDPEDYVHRVGRTARAGAEGKAIMLACDDYVYGLPALEKYLKRPVPTEWAGDELFGIDRSGSWYRARKRGKVYTGFESVRAELRDDDRGARGESDDGGDAEPASAREGAKSERRRRKRRKDDGAKAAADGVVGEGSEAPRSPAEHVGPAADAPAKPKKKRRRRRKKLVEAEPEGGGEGAASPATDGAADAGRAAPKGADAKAAGGTPGEEAQAAKAARSSRPKRRRARHSLGDGRGLAPAGGRPRHA